MALNKWDNLFTLQIFTECWLSAYTTLSPKHVHIIFTSTHMGKHYHTHPCRSVYILMHVHVYHSLLMYTYKHMEYKEGYTFHILRSSEIGYTLLMIKDPRQHWQKVNLVFSLVLPLPSSVLWLQESWQHDSSGSSPWLIDLALREVLSQNLWLWIPETIFSDTWVLGKRFLSWSQPLWGLCYFLCLLL